MDKLAEIRLPIEEELKSYHSLFEGSLQSGNPLLQRALTHVMQRRGKLMRPILVLLAARFAGGRNSVNEQVLHAAVSLELLHTASLVHDDVVDESDRRRGLQSVNALLGNKVAVLVGDFLLSKALYHAAKTGSGRVVTWISEMGQTLSDGELLQLANLDKTTISTEDYFEVIRKKTASLFETCAKAGALLSGGGEEDVRMMAQFGLQTGVCFQLRDDIFDYDIQHDTGKPSGNDMKEGKLTLPVIHALLSSGDASMHDLAMEVRGGDATPEEIAQLLDFTYQQHGIEYAEKSMYKIGEETIALLDYKKDCDQAIVQSLSQYVRFVVGRDI